ncbi:MAG: acyltransferase [Sulfurovaceae bacterium]|nr:acyltransferase [Sulfurovaceae bacterium]
MKYRKDIDGLRAIAVLAVLFYHLGFSFISGGFIGVDIFFVISGFLITQSIQNDLKDNIFTIKHFYIKRIRRIVPLLFVTTMVTMVVALFVLPIEDLKEFALSVTSVSLFGSNIFFWQHIDYFSVSAELKPLLHTWSLGIEEQFYIFFPLFMMWTATWRSKKVFIATAIFTFLSFALCASPFGASHIQANFFLPITRFWELFMGVLLALFLSRNSEIKSNKTLDNILALLGLGFIISPLLLLDYNSIFPGINALYPVVGSVLIIYSGNRGESFLVAILSHKIVRYIGLISFSLYLWHWSIIAFAKNIIIGEFSLGDQMFMLLLTFVLSALSYRFIEEPFRRDKRLKEWLQIKNGLIALGILALSSLLLFLFLKLSFPDTRLKHKEVNCFKTEMTMQSIKECSFGEMESNRTFVLYGDSHASALYPAFEKLANEKKMRGIFIPLSGCAPLFDVRRNDGVGNASNCTGEYAKNIENFLETNAKEIEHLYLVGRWTMYEKGWILNGRLQQATHFLSNSEIESKTAKESAMVLKKAVVDTVGKISGAFGIPMSILKSVPNLHGDIGKRGLKNVTKEEYLAQLAYTNEIFNKLEKRDGLYLVDPIEIFCPKDECLMYEGNQALYRDDNHVNYEGAMKFYPLLDKN